MCTFQPLPENGQQEVRSGSLSPQAWLPPQLSALSKAFFRLLFSFAPRRCDEEKAP